MTMPRFNNDHGRIVNAAIVRAASKKLLLPLFHGGKQLLFS